MIGSKQISFYGLVILAALVGAAADAFVNQWVKHQRVNFVLLLLGILAWNVALLIFIRVLATQTLSSAAAVFLVTNGLVACAISALYFGEKLSGVSLIGILVALFGIFLMEAGR